MFTVDGDGNLDCIVKRDGPKNGEYYVIEENGVVEGLYGRYRAYDDGTDDGHDDEDVMLMVMMIMMGRMTVLVVVMIMMMVLMMVMTMKM